MEQEEHSTGCKHGTEIDVKVELLGSWPIEFHPQRLYLKYKMTKTFHFKLS